MDTDAIERPFVIHLGADPSVEDRLTAHARSRGMSVIELDLAGVPDDEALADYLAATFEYPYPTKGLDAAVDLISDLEWWGNAGGYMIVARGVPDSSPIAVPFASIFPNVVDRWRTQEVPFVVAIDGNGDRLQAALRSANARMDEAGNLPWAQPGTGAVDVIVHPVVRSGDVTN